MRVYAARLRHNVRLYRVLALQANAQLVLSCRTTAHKRGNAAQPVHLSISWYNVPRVCDAIGSVLGLCLSALPTATCHVSPGTTMVVNARLT